MTSPTRDHTAERLQEQIAFLQRWYRLELLGIRISSILAEAPSMSEHRHKWQALGRMETIMCDKIGQVLNRHGRLPNDDESIEKEAAEIAQKLIKEDWRSAMTQLSCDLRDWLDELMRFEGSVADEFRQLARALTRHEEAWLEFSLIEAQSGDRSVATIERAIREL